MLKKLCTVLSIIVTILGCGIGVFYIITSFTMDSTEFFGPLLNIFSFFGGIVCLLYTVVIVAAIWIIYGIIKLIGKFYTKLYSNKKRYLN